MMDLSDVELEINPAGYDDAYLSQFVWGTLRLSSIRTHRMGCGTRLAVQAVYDAERVCEWRNVAMLTFPEDTSDDDMDRIAEEALMLCKLRWGGL